jgi:peptidoglycan-N-acetylmuramic acid deacetylase
VNRVFAAVLALTVFAICFLSSPVDAASTGQPYHFGFKKSKNGRPASINEEGFKDVVQKNGAIFMGDTTQKELYLTFDNGYENGNTAKILDVLKEKRVPAAFFVTGHFVKDQPDLVKRMTAEGHVIGNHSWSHPDMTQISGERIKAELDKVQAETVKLTGQAGMHFLRPPRGIFSDAMLAEAAKNGYTSVFWSVAYKDWDIQAQRGGDYAYDSVVKQLHPGAVILLHSVSKDNADAMGRIIDEAARQGYTFKSLEQMQKRSY